jgi:hypothetical protein
MKALDCGHFLAFLGYFDAISHQKKPTVYPQDMGKNLKNDSEPSMREFIQFKTAPMIKI